MTVRRAVWVGTVVVNGPVLALCVGPLGAFAFAVDRGWVSRDWNAAGLPVFLASVGLAWLWWSVSVPRWRTWALARVDEPDALREAAVDVGLTWPAGHPLERTELRRPDDHP